jgi:hypothetical protein
LQSSFDARYNPDHFATHHLTLDEKSFDPAAAAAGDEPEEVLRRHGEVAVVGHNSSPACDVEAHTEYAASWEVPEQPRAYHAAAGEVRFVEVVASEEVEVLASSRTTDSTNVYCNLSRQKE